MLREKPWVSVSMDFVSGFLEVNNMSSMTVVMNKSSKYGVILGMLESCTAKTIANLFYRNIVKHFGVSYDIVSDWN